MHCGDEKSNAILSANVVERGDKYNDEDSDISPENTPDRTMCVSSAPSEGLTESGTVSIDEVRHCSDDETSPKVNYSEEKAYSNVRTNNQAEGFVRDFDTIMPSKSHNLPDYTEAVILGFNVKASAFLKDVENVTNNVLGRNKLKGTKVTRKKKQEEKTAARQIFANEMREVASIVEAAIACAAPSSHKRKSSPIQVENPLAERYTTSDTHNKTPLNASNKVTFAFIDECCKALVPYTYSNMTELCKDVATTTGLEWFLHVDRMNKVRRQESNVNVPEEEKTALMNFLSEKTGKRLPTKGDAIVPSPMEEAPIEEAPSGTCTIPPWWIRFCEGLLSWTRHVCKDQTDVELGRFMIGLQAKSEHMEWLTVDNWKKLLDKMYIEIPETILQFLVKSMRSGGYLISDDDQLLCSQLKAFVDHCERSEGWTQEDVWSTLRENGADFMTRELFQDMLSVSLVNDIAEYHKLWLRCAIARITQDNSVIMSSPIRPVRKKKLTTILPSMAAPISEPDSGSCNVLPTPKVLHKRSRPSSRSPSLDKKRHRKDKKPGSTSVPPSSNETVTVVKTKSGRSASKFVLVARGGGRGAKKDK